MKVGNSKEIEVLRYSDSSYKKITAEIHYRGEPIAQINQDKGQDKAEIQIFSFDKSGNDLGFKVSLSEFIDIIEEAKQRIGI